MLTKKQAVENPNLTLTNKVPPISLEFKSCFADPKNHTNKHLFTYSQGIREKPKQALATRKCSLFDGCEYAE